MHRRILVIAVTVFWFLPVVASTTATIDGVQYEQIAGTWHMIDPDGEYWEIAPNWIQIRFDSLVTETQRDTFASNHNLTLLPVIVPMGFYRFEYDAAADPIEALQGVYGSAVVAEAGLDTFVKSLGDPFFGEQWNLLLMDIERAWQVSTGDAPITIAFIDKGIDKNHPDLAATRWTNPNDPIGGGDDDNDFLWYGEDLTDDYWGWDFWGDGAGNDDNEPSPLDYPEGDPHGTPVAGMAMAVTDNNEGLAGIAGGSTSSRPIKWASVVAPSTMSSAAAIRYCREKGFNIVSISQNLPKDQIIGPELDTLYMQGTLIFGGSGNSGENGTAKVIFPANHPDVIAVGATDDQDIVWDYSNHGTAGGSISQGVELVAPSGYKNTSDLTELFVWSTDNEPPSFKGYNDDPNCVDPFPINCDYTLFGGTSAACPTAAGVAALLWSYNPQLTNVAVRQILRNSARKVGGAPNAEYGYGRIDAYRALTQWGTIPADTVWSGDVYVSGDVLVDSAVTLTIDPGTTVWIMPDDVNWAINPQVSPAGVNDTLRSEIWVKGFLDVNGTASDPVVFKAWDSSGESIDEDAWFGIFVWENAGAGADFDYCVIKNALRGIQSRSFINVRNTTIEKCAWQGISVAFADSVFIENTTISGPEESGLRLGLATARISNSTIENVDMYGAWVRDGSVLYADGTAFLDADIGVYLFPDSEVTATAYLDDCTISGTFIDTGVQADSGSVAEITNCQVSGIGRGVVINDAIVEIDATSITADLLCVDVNGGSCTATTDTLGASGPSASSVFIDDVDDVLFRDTIISGGLYGVKISGAGGEVTLKTLTVTGTDLGGIYVSGADSTAIDSCTVASNDDGVVVYGAPTVVVSNSLIDDNSVSGIWANADADNVIITSNVVTNNAIGIYCLDGSSPTIGSGNEIDDNTTGIKCDDYSHPQVRLNYIRDNGVGVAALQESDPNLGGSCSGACGAGCTSKGDNEITGSTSYHVSNLSTSLTIQAECNYWNFNARTCDYAPKATKLYGDVDVCPALAGSPLASAGAGEGYQQSNADFPTKFSLAQNYPNPFNPTTRINYDVPLPGAHVVIDIFDVSGARVKRLINEQKTAGYHNHVWDGSSDAGAEVATGVYFVRMTAGAFRSTIKIVLLK